MSPGTSAVTGIETIAPSAHDVGLDRHRMPQGLGRLFGAMFLHDVERHRQRSDGDDDRQSCQVAADSGNRRGRQQHARPAD